MTAGSSYWRRAGLSYLKYANVCADALRQAMKEPARSQAKLRETVYYRSSTWKDGKQEKQGVESAPLLTSALQDLLAFLASGSHSAILSNDLAFGRLLRHKIAAYFGVDSRPVSKGSQDLVLIRPEALTSALIKDRTADLLKELSHHAPLAIAGPMAGGGGAAAALASGHSTGLSSAGGGGSPRAHSPGNADFSLAALAGILTSTSAGRAGASASSPEGGTSAPGSAGGAAAGTAAAGSDMSAEALSMSMLSLGFDAERLQKMQLAAAAAAAPPASVSPSTVGTVSRNRQFAQPQPLQRAAAAEAPAPRPGAPAAGRGMARMPPPLPMVTVLPGPYVPAASALPSGPRLAGPLAPSTAPGGWGPYGMPASAASAAAAAGPGGWMGSAPAMPFGPGAGYMPTDPFGAAPMDPLSFGMGAGGGAFGGLPSPLQQGYGGGALGQAFGFREMGQAAAGQGMGLAMGMNAMGMQYAPPPPPHMGPQAHMMAGGGLMAAHNPSGGPQGSYGMPMGGMYPPGFSRPF